MTDQPTLFDPAGRIEVAFRAFHADHPHVYDLIVRFAREAKAAGFERYGMKSIWERLRWHLAIETSDPSGFHLNNVYTAWFAREVMEREPDLEGFFEIRALRAG